MRLAALPEDLLRFQAHFNDGAFWEGHEVLETPWRRNGSTFYKGLIICASAFVHAQRGNPTGVLKQFAKAQRYLAPYAPAYMGVDVAMLLDHMQSVTAWLGDHPDIRGEALRNRMPYPKIHLDPGRIRGDEPELVQTS